MYVHTYVCELGTTQVKLCINRSRYLRMYYLGYWLSKAGALYFSVDWKIGDITPFSRLLQEAKGVQCHVTS